MLVALLELLLALFLSMILSTRTGTAIASDVQESFHSFLAWRRGAFRPCLTYCVSLTAGVPMSDSQRRRLMSAQTLVGYSALHAVAEVGFTDACSILPPRFMGFGVFHFTGCARFATAERAS